MIPAVCPGCGRASEVSDKFSGRQVTCPQCQTQYVIGAGPPVAAQLSGDVGVQDEAREEPGAARIAVSGKPDGVADEQVPRQMDDNSQEASKSKFRFGLAGWALWAVIFAILNVTVGVGGAVGGLIAGGLSAVIMSGLPAGNDGKKLPDWLSVLLFPVAVAIFIAGMTIGRSR